MGSAALLAGDTPRSQHDPDLEAEAEAATSIAMHPVTGAFADPTQELAFAAQFFRLSFEGHLVLMAIYIATLMFVAFSTPAMWPLMSAWAFFASLGLIGRIRIHRLDDTVCAQRIGSWIWTAMLVNTVLIDVGGLALFTPLLCEATALVYSTMYGGLLVVWTVLVNGSHGMGFAHKAVLISSLLLDSYLAVGVCGLAWLPCIGLSGVSISVFGVAHLAEMHLRHSYADKQRLEEQKRRLEKQMNEEAEESRRLEERLEQLRAEKERLMYDVQRRGQPLDDGDDRSALRRGLLAGPSEPYQRADSTGSSETGAPAPSDSPPASLPPGAPSSSAGKSSKSGESGKGTGRSSNAAHGKSTVPPPHWAELAYREFHAAKAAQSRTEQGVPPEAPPQARPPTWEELDAEYYADIAKSAIEPRTAPLASAEACRHGAPSSSQVSRTSAAATPAAPLPPRPASQQAESDGALDRSCAEMAAASTAEQAGARRARGTKRAVAACCGGHNHCGGDCGGNNHCGGVAEVTTGAGKASVGKASAGRARAAKNPTTEQGIEQLQSWKVSSDPIYVAARARLSAAQAPADSAQRRST